MIKLGLPGNEISLPEPTDITETPIEIKREARTADGSLVTDIIAVKYVYTLTYVYLTYEEMESIESIITDMGNRLNLVIKKKNRTETISVRVSLPPKKLVLAYGPWGYENITIIMEAI